MPSPFPGMDPYLENPALWPSVHQGVLYRAYESLNARLPAPFVANLGERMYVAEAARSIYPDIAVVGAVGRPEDGEVVPGGGVAVADAEEDAPLLVTLGDAVREPFIEILDVRSGERVVTIIELLSHANKAAGSDGRRQYLAKQTEALESGTHLLEVDLLRAGEPTLLPVSHGIGAGRGWQYVACLHRAGRGRTFEVWACSVRDRLPRAVRVPLTDGFPDVTLDLQTLLDGLYDAGAFARRVDYRRATVPPLSPADAAWADGLLHEKGLR